MVKENDYFEGLIAKYLSGEASQEETETLLEWIEEDEAHKEEFFQIKTIWNETGALKLYFDEDKEWRKLHRRINKIRRLNYQGFWVRFSQIAAVFFIAFAVGWFVKTQYTKEPDKSWLKVTVPTGQITQLTLSDSSKVWLNSESTLKYPSNFSEHRNVNLSGEAYFDVNEEKKHAFTVKTGYMNVQVMGTRFNVRAYSDDEEFQATVLEGQVSLNDGLSNKPRSILYKGDQASFSRSNNELSVLQLTENPERSIGWIKGRYEFHDQPLSQILNFASRWYGVKFIVKDKELINTRFTGVMKREYPLDQLLDLIKKTEDVTIINQKDKIILKLDKENG